MIILLVREMVLNGLEPSLYKILCDVKDLSTNSALSCIWLFFFVFCWIVVSVFSGHQNSSFYVKSSISPDNQFLISGSSDRCAYIWKVSSVGSDYNIAMLFYVHFVQERWICRHRGKIIRFIEPCFQYTVSKVHSCQTWIQI